MEQLALQIHIVTVIVLVVVILYTDSLGMSWMRGKRETLPRAKIARLHSIVWVGLGIMIATGITMFIPLRDYLLYTPSFYVKMGFVAALIINATFIGRFMHIASERPFEALTQKERLPLFISGTISTISWIGAIVSALLLGL